MVNAKTSEGGQASIDNRFSTFSPPPEVCDGFAFGGHFSCHPESRNPDTNCSNHAFLRAFARPGPVHDGRRGSRGAVRAGRGVGDGGEADHRGSSQSRSRYIITTLADVLQLPGATETAASFQFEGEGHTLGNALRYTIMKKCGLHSLCCCDGWLHYMQYLFAASAGHKLTYPPTALTLNSADTPSLIPPRRK